MTSTPGSQVGLKHVWITCTGLEESTCTNFYQEDHEPDAVVDWGSATAAFGEVDAYRVYGKRISALLVNRTVNPLYNPSNPDLYPQYLEEVVPTCTHRIDVDTSMPEYIYPAIEIYDGIPVDCERVVGGIIDGTYFVYPVVFKDAKICYLPRCSGVGADFTGEVCVDGVNPFPLEPYFPDCDPPVYPMDAITAWLPSSQEFVDIKFSATWEYYNLDADPDKTDLQSATIQLDLRVLPPPFDWSQGEYFHNTYTYFGNGIYH